MEYCQKPPPQDILAHHGIMGMKWGVRRYQNPDGSLTTAGKRRYGDNDEKKSKKKVAATVAVGAGVVAGTILTAYLVKKIGAKKIPKLTQQAEIGKEVVDKVLKTSPMALMPISQISPQNVSTKAAVDKIVTTASEASPPVRQIPKPSASTAKAVYEIPQTYSFETLMRQNNELLKKMYADLA